MNLDDIKIVDSTPQDVFVVRNVQKITWIDTYPNLELGITKEDIESEFSKDYKLKWLGKSKFLVKRDSGVAKSEILWFTRRRINLWKRRLT